MERTYYLRLGNYDAYVDLWIDGDRIRMDKVRFFDLDLVADATKIKNLRNKWSKAAIIGEIQAKYDFSGGINVGIWVDPITERIYDIHCVVGLKDGFEKYVLARDMKTWGWVLLDIERVQND